MLIHCGARETEAQREVERALLQTQGLLLAGAPSPASRRKRQAPLGNMQYFLIWAQSQCYGELLFFMKLIVGDQEAREGWEVISGCCDQRA